MSRSVAATFNVDVDAKSVTKIGDRQSETITLLLIFNFSQYHREPKVKTVIPIQGEPVALNKCKHVKDKARTESFSHYFIEGDAGELVFFTK